MILLRVYYTLYQLLPPLEREGKIKYIRPPYREYERQKMPAP
jgi:hypothetical protein